jgi:hypothetical protein
MCVPPVNNIVVLSLETRSLVVYVPRTMRGLTTTYRAQFHCQCAIAPGSPPVQTCHVPCAVSLPVRDRHWLTSSADVARTGRTVRCLTASAQCQLTHLRCRSATYRAQSHCQCAIATGSRQVQTCHVPCAVSLTPSARSQLAHLRRRRAMYNAQSHSQCAIATGSRQVHTSSADVSCTGRSVRGLTASARSQLADVPCTGRSARCLTASARSQLAHLTCRRGTYWTYRALSHCQCAMPTDSHPVQMVATGSHQVQICHAPCTVSPPVLDGNWLTSSADLPRTVRSLTPSV